MTLEAQLAAAVPRGLGMYVLDISERVMGTPEQAARKAVEHGLSFVALAACWQEPKPGLTSHRPMNQADLDDYGQAFRAAGVLPWVWGYPWGADGLIDPFVETMVRSARKAQAVGVILDPELGYRGKPELMRQLLERTINGLSEDLGLGFTSYGLPSSMGDFPWHVAGGYGWGSPQCYQAPLAQARRGLEQWRQHGWQDLVVSLPTFGRNTETDGGQSDPSEMVAYCSALLELTGGAGIFWQWATTNAAEWRAIKLLAAREQIVSPERPMLEVA